MTRSKRGAEGQGVEDREVTYMDLGLNSSQLVRLGRSATHDGREVERVEKGSERDDSKVRAARGKGKGV